MAKPARSRAMRNRTIRNLESAANSTLKTADKAASGLLRWAWTDHSGMSKSLANLPLLGLGFIGSVKYILSSFLITIAGAVLTGVWIFLLIGYGIPFLIMGHF